MKSHAFINKGLSQINLKDVPVDPNSDKKSPKTQTHPLIIWLEGRKTLFKNSILHEFFQIDYPSIVTAYQLLIKDFLALVNKDKEAINEFFKSANEICDTNSKLLKKTIHRIELELIHIDKTATELANSKISFKYIDGKNTAAAEKLRKETIESYQKNCQIAQDYLTAFERIKSLKDIPEQINQYQVIFNYSLECQKLTDAYISINDKFITFMKEQGERIDNYTKEVFQLINENDQEPLDDKKPIDDKYLQISENCIAYYERFQDFLDELKALLAQIKTFSSHIAPMPEEPLLVQDYLKHISQNLEALRQNISITSQTIQKQFSITYGLVEQIQKYLSPEQVEQINSYH